jgi:hypothetical protein
MDRTAVTSGIVIFKEEEPESPTTAIRFTPGSLLAQKYGVDGQKKTVDNKY